MNLRYYNTFSKKKPVQIFKKHSKSIGNRWFGGEKNFETGNIFGDKKSVH